MRLVPGGLAEYRRLHDSIWPEMLDEMQKHGIRQISVFESDPVLFLYAEVTDDEAFDRLFTSEVYLGWAALMAPLMEMAEGGVVATQELPIVFSFVAPADEERQSSRDAIVSHRLRPERPPGDAGPGS